MVVIDNATNNKQVRVVVTSYEQYMSVREAMQRLRKSDATIRRYMREGTLRFKSDRQRRVHLLREDVERIALQESQFSSPDDEMVMLDQDARIAELERSVFNLTQEMNELRALVEQLASQPPAQPHQTRTFTPASSALPDGLISFRKFAGEHGIPENTAKNAIESGRLGVTEGAWKSGYAIIRKAFDPEQQRDFVKAYRKYHPNFHECDREDCPCHE
jgi:transposase